MAACLVLATTLLLAVANTPQACAEPVTAMPSIVCALADNHLHPADCTDLKVDAHGLDVDAFRAALAEKPAKLRTVALPYTLAQLLAPALAALPALEDVTLTAPEAVGNAAVEIAEGETMDTQPSELVAALWPLLARTPPLETVDARALPNAQAFTAALAVALKKRRLRHAAEAADTSRDTPVEALAKGPHSVVLQDAQLGNAGAAAVAAMLEAGAGVERLDLAGTGIGAAGAEALARALESNTQLAELDLRRNVLGREGIDALAHALAHNTALRELHLPTPQETTAEEEDAAATPEPSVADTGREGRNTVVTPADADAVSDVAPSPSASSTPSVSAAALAAAASAAQDALEVAASLVPSPGAASSKTKGAPTPALVPASATLRADIADAIAANRAVVHCAPDELVEGGKCVSECSAGHMTQASTRRCVPCTPPCAECSMLTTNCTACRPPLLLENHACVASCGSQAVARPGTAATGGVCEPCHAECLGCFGPGPRACFSCRHFSNSGACVVHCPKGKTPDDVYRCRDSLASPLRAWLEALRLRKYADLFHRDMVTFELLGRFTDEDLRELGIRFSPERLRLQTAVAERLAALPSRFAALARRQGLHLPAAPRLLRLRRTASRAMAWLGLTTAPPCTLHSVADVQVTLATEAGGRLVQTVLAGVPPMAAASVAGAGAASANGEDEDTGDESADDRLAEAVAREAVGGNVSLSGSVSSARTAITCRRAWRALQRLVLRHGPTVLPARHPTCNPESVARLAAWALGDLVHELRLVCPRVASGRGGTKLLHDEL